MNTKAPKIKIEGNDKIITTRYEGNDTRHEELIYNGQNLRKKTLYWLNGEKYKEEYYENNELIKQTGYYQSKYGGSVAWEWTPKYFVTSNPIL